MVGIELPMIYLPRHGETEIIEINQQQFGPQLTSDKFEA